MTMHYVSTRGAAPVLGFGEAMMTGLARDGGLYVPESVPVLSKAEIAAVLIGPSGNLRAPTVRKGRVLLVGFDEETYARFVR